MLQAVSFALLDSVNILLIGIIVAIAAFLPKTGKYGRITTLLIAGDWLGVFALCLVVMLIFDGLGDLVEQFLESPAYGIILIVVGIISFIATMLSKGGGNSEMIERFLGPVRAPSWKTVVAGFILGLVQSLTSLPFYLGLAILSAGDFSVSIRYGGLVVYASLALSLPAIVALLVGLVRAYPESPIGVLFDKAGRNRTTVAKAAGYIVAVLLTGMGVISLL